MKKPISKISNPSTKLRASTSDPRKKLSPEVRDALDAYHAETQAHIDALNKKSDREMKKYVADVLEKTAMETQRYIGSLTEESRKNLRHRGTIFRAERKSR
ncbi:MAG: hypothetical protein WC878_01260 [Candidatus Paceibacterota bacterium]|jgi:fructose-1,6-bisphosphatase